MNVARRPTVKTPRGPSRCGRAGLAAGSLFKIAVSSLLLAVLLAGGTGCAKRRRGNDIALLTADEKYRLGIQYMEKHRYQKAIDVLGGINQYEAENRQELEPLVRLAMADATFYQGTDISLIDARSMYLDFVTLYGDHRLAPYAQFQAGICSYKQVIHPARDQTQTHLAVEDLTEVEERYPNDRFTGAARLTVSQSEQNLAEHEILVGRFYMKRKKYVASIDRFRDVLDLYPGIDDKDKVYYYLGESLMRSDNAEEGRVYLDKLIHDFPDGKFTELARKSLDAAGFDAEVEVAGSP